MENKICVYTVCMNESHHIESWVKSMSEADKIVALVHDCTDDTEQKLKDLGVIVETTHYDKWRFDVGKNDSMHAAMKNAPDCNILAFTSLDEIWEPGWAQVLKDNWQEDTNICCYKFVQSRNEDGSDGLVTGFNWIHSNESAWYWKYPIDERICRDDKPFVYVNLFDQLKLNHWPDLEKPRPYVDLRRQMWEEFQDDASLLCLVRDYHYIKKDEDLYNILHGKDFRAMTLCDEEKCFICCCYADVLFRYKHDIEEAQKYFEEAISIDPGFRKPYILYGIHLCDLHMYREAEYILKEALTKAGRRYTWLEAPSNFEGDLFIWLTVATYYSGKVYEALGYAERALQLRPNDELAKNNVKYCLDSIANAY